MSTYEVRRSVTVAAGTHAVHALIDDFRQWARWSPWDDLDPDMQRTYEGAESGVGARYAWSGNRKAGVGSMRITASTPERIDAVVAFEKPFRSTSDCAFLMQPVDGGTEVTWVMTGEQRGFQALFGRIVPMDRLIGGDFERGLDRLKAAAEA